MTRQIRWLIHGDAIHALCGEIACIAHHEEGFLRVFFYDGTRGRHCRFASALEARDAIEGYLHGRVSIVALSEKSERAGKEMLIDLAVEVIA